MIAFCEDICRGITWKHASQLHDLGFSLLPLRGKRPVVKWKHFQEERAPLSLVRKWFGEQGHQIGIITGRVSGVVAIDCDSQEAVDRWLKLYAPTPLTQDTPRGRHFLYRHTSTQRCHNRSNAELATDVRGDGGYIVAYPDSQTWTLADLLDTPDFLEDVLSA